MKVLAIAILCTSCVSSTRDAGNLAPDPGQGTVVGTPGEPPSTARLIEVTTTGPGHVTSDPAGIDCGGGATACSATLDGDVVLRASDDATVRWSGACAGNGDCVVAASAPGKVGADTFAPIVRTFDDSDHGTDACHGVAMADDGSFVVAGEVQRLAEGRNAWARRYDAAGGEQWTFELHTPSEGADAARGAIALAGGGAVLAGQWYSGSPSATNHFVAQIGADGAQQWLDEGELMGSDDYSSIAQTATGELLVAGALESQAWVRELDATGGDTGWQVEQGSNAAARRVVVAPSGDVIVGGSDAGQGWITRYQDHAAVGSFQLDTAVDDLAVVQGGVAVVAGGALTVYADDGAVQWSAPAETAVAWHAVAARADGSIAVAGSLGESLVVRVYAADGTKLWQRTLANAAPEAVATDAAGDIVACGSRGGDLLVVKLAQ